MPVESGVREAVAEHGFALTLVPELEADRIVATLADRFVERPSATFWWDALQSPFTSLYYGATTTPFDNGVRALEALAGAPSKVILMIFRLNEREVGGAAEVWRGRIDETIRCLGDLPAFEFAITDDTNSWAIFDTHHDSIVIAGKPPGSVPPDLLPADP